MDDANSNSINIGVHLLAESGDKLNESAIVLPLNTTVEQLQVRWGYPFIFSFWLSFYSLALFRLVVSYRKILQKYARLGVMQSVIGKCWWSGSHSV